MMNNLTAILWRRLDKPGHDACQYIEEKNGGWTLEGSAVFVEAGQVCQLRYKVLADASFCTKEAMVTGWFGNRTVDLRICVGRMGAWAVNSENQPQLLGCVDLDLGFTPATNFLAIRRLNLKVTEEAQAPAAYLAFPQLNFSVLPQHYKRLAPTAYEYEAPTANYSGTLGVSEQGIIMHYPGLFTAEC